MELDAVIDALRRSNRRADEATIRAYATALRDYLVAEANVAEHGTIVFHPRTGAPIENPYLAIRERCQAAMARARLRHTEEAWRLATLPSAAGP